ncbi:MAG: hypothetical protein WCK55_03185 [Verrucomicrobiota bacterium]|jgi:hypothetical protein
MVRGLDLFRERFRSFQGFMTLIGGAACDEWFTTNGLTFRATNDLDLVIMMDDVAPAFIAAIRAFVAEGGYEISERSEGVPILYRFSDPAREDFPAKLELSSRKPDGFELSDGQKYIPISAGLGRHSLSAILLNDAYFGLIQTHHDERDGLWIANATALIPLKAHAWLNLMRAKAAGESVDSQNIKKHRADVFRLAATLPGDPGPELPASVTADLTSFLGSFPVGSTEWPAIVAAVEATIGAKLQPANLRAAIQTYFRLPA